MEFPAQPWCISIERLEHRRKLFRKNWGGEVNFHVGFDYQDVDIDQLLERYSKRPMFSSVCKGWLAIYFGHLTLWRQLLSSSNDRWLIFEDDAMPTGVPFCEPRGPLFRYFKPPPEYPSWCSAACYFVTRPFVERLVDCTVAAAPDRVLKSVEDGDPLFADPSPVQLIDTQCSYSIDTLWETRASCD